MGSPNDMINVVPALRPRPHNVIDEQTPWRNWWTTLQLYIPDVIDVQSPNRIDVQKPQM